MEESDGTWLGEIPDLPGCHTFGDTLDQARWHIRDAIGLWLETEDVAIIEANKERYQA